jgi:hypothetical protein
MLPTRLFTYGLMTLLIPAALMGAQVAPEPAITAFTSLQKLATEFITRESIEQAFNQTFIFICNLVVQQRADLGRIKEWLHGQNIVQEIDRHVDLVKEQLNQMYAATATMGTHSDTDAHRTVGLQKFSALEHEQRQLHIKLRILASLLDQDANVELFTDAKRLQDAVEKQLRPSMAGFITWLKNFVV